jgi:hypothetical protein
MSAMLSEQFPEFRLKGWNFKNSYGSREYATDYKT